MSAPSAAWLKLKTRQLIKANGGTEAASEICEAECRTYGAPQLSKCETAGNPAFLPLDILACLEAAAGDPIISRALCERGQGATTPKGSLTDEACDLSEAAMELQKHIRAALADDGQIDPAEASALLAKTLAAKKELAEVEALLMTLTKRGVG